MPAEDAQSAPPRWYWAAVGGLLLVQSLLAIDCARRWTPTHDEYWHLPLGLLMWREPAFGIDPINPPLPRLLAAAPLWLMGTSSGDVTPDAETTRTAYTVADAFLREHGAELRSRYFLGRLIMVAIAALGGVAIALWAQHWYGWRSGLLAAALWAGCPTVLAHSALVAHDLPCTVAVVLFGISLWQFCRRPTLGRAAICGAVLGIACLTKFTSLALIPATPFAWALMPGRDRATPTRRWLMFAAAGALTALLVVNLGYPAASEWDPAVRWFGRPHAGGRAERSAVESLARVVLPPSFVDGLKTLRDVMRQPHPVYLDGEWREAGGFRDYYLRALRYKWPLTTWLCLILGGWSLWSRRSDPDERRKAALLGLGVLLFLVPASLSGNQLGLRYILPAFPFLFVIGSAAARWVDFRTTPKRAVLVLMTAALIPAAWRHHPQHLGYFNELAGGPEHGWRHLIDSNIDWGQDLHALRDAMAASDTGGLRLAYFGTVSPSAIGVDYDGLPPPREPQPGRYAVSVSFVAGRPHHLRDIDGRAYFANLDDFGYFRFFEPAQRIGNSILIYNLTPTDITDFHEARTAAMRGAK